MNELIALLEQVRGCNLCAAALPHEPRPVIQAADSARILIIGQAPGRKVHASGIPFDDASGDRLRAWMGIDKRQFYDASRIAIMPMGFCYPGKGASGDLPPRPECAPTWHDKVLQLLPNIALTLLIGQYAQKYYLQKRFDSLTDVVRRWQDFAPERFPLPHPSPRNQLWLKKHPWFEQQVVPALRSRVASIVS